MSVLFIITLGLILIGLLIILLWRYEIKVPSIDFSYNSKNDKYQGISNWFDNLYKLKKFNGVVLYTKKEEILLKKTLGYIDYKATNTINSKTMFRLASCSKQFTAFGIMLLQHQNRIQYDDLVTVYIQNFPYPKVTIRHLLNQTSGITVDYIKLAKKKGKKHKNYILSNKDAVDLICNYVDDKIRDPLEFYLYNNTNYIILAYLIQIITKTSFEDYMQQEVFTPLKLHRTRVWNLLSKKINFNEHNIAEGFESYLKSKPRQIQPNWVDGVAGDGAVFSCIDDLIIWSSIWDSNILITQEELQEAFKKPTLKDGTQSSYGFGWVISPNKTLWHNGSWLASNSLIVKKIEEQSTFILIDNSTNLRFDKISKKIGIYTNNKNE